MPSARPDHERPTAGDHVRRARAAAAARGSPTNHFTVLAGIAAAIGASTLVGVLFSSTDRQSDRSATDAAMPIDRDDASAPGSRVRRARRRLATASKRYIDPLFRMPRLTDSRRRP